jgi:hypothetical protein
VQGLCCGPRQVLCVGDRSGHSTFTSTAAPLVTHHDAHPGSRTHGGVGCSHGGRPKGCQFANAGTPFIINPFNFVSPLHLLSNLFELFLADKRVSTSKAVGLLMV